MIDRVHRMSVSRQARLLGISRGSVYYQRRPPSTADLALMRRLDALHLEYPFAGSRMLLGLLRQDGYGVGRLHVATLMKQMGIAALYRRPATSHPTPGHQIYPYLLRKLAVTRPNHVWAMDITYVPMARGFVYLVAVLDWFSRKVLAWRLSITLETRPCVEALSDALARHGPPAIMNTVRAASSPLWLFSRRCRRPRSRLAWTARARGATMFLSNGSGGRSNMRKSTSGPIEASRRHVAVWAAIWHSITDRDRIQLLAGKHLTKSISTSLSPSRRRHNPSGDPLINSLPTVQNRRATSPHGSYPLRRCVALILRRRPDKGPT